MIWWLWWRMPILYVYYCLNLCWEWLKNLMLKTIAYAMLYTTFKPSCYVGSMYHLSPSIQFIHNCFPPMTYDWLRPMRLKIIFPILTPMHDGSHVYLCLDSEVQQNLSKPWSFWAKGTRWCWFLSLGELGFEALTSLVDFPRFLVLTVDTPP